MKYLVLLLLLSACVANPYVQPGMNNNTVEEKIVEKVVVQCWDGSTAESVDKCPAKEVEKAPEIVIEAPKTTIAKRLLDEARTKFTSHAYLFDDRMVIVVGNKVRHLYLKMSEVDKTPITDVFVDLEKKEAVAYCNVEREGRDILGDSFDWDRSRCKDYIDKPIPVEFDKWVTKGPLEYLEDFSALEPILVENNVQTISIGGNSKTVIPSLHYMINGKRVILRIDKRYQIPLKIEREGERSIDFRDVYFDIMVLNGRQFKLGPEWVEYTPVSEYWKKVPS